MAKERVSGVSKKPVEKRIKNYEAQLSLGKALLDCQVDLPKEQASISIEAKEFNRETERFRVLGTLSVSQGGVLWSVGKSNWRFSWSDFSDRMKEPKRRRKSGT